MEMVSHPDRAGSLPSNSPQLTQSMQIGLKGELRQQIHLKTVHCLAAFDNTPLWKPIVLSVSGF